MRHGIQCGGNRHSDREGRDKFGIIQDDFGQYFAICQRCFYAVLSLAKNGRCLAARIGRGNHDLWKVRAIGNGLA